jgi:AcrR family transcriptional regulator
MRVRTEDKRNEIIDVASALFQEHGFERTSMSLISQRVGGSKATLYGYFRSKEELFLATINFNISANAELLTRALLSARTLREGLVALGSNYLMLRLGPQPVSNFRIVSTQPAESGIGQMFYHHLLRPAWQRLADRFEMMMDEGKLRRADPWLAAMHWKGLIEGDLLDRRVLGVIDAPDPKEVGAQARAATDAFLQVYGAEAATPAQARPRAARRPADNRRPADKVRRAASVKAVAGKRPAARNKPKPRTRAKK